MAQQSINLGTTANDGTGDSPRSTGAKINANFTEVYTGLAGKAATSHTHTATDITSGTMATARLGSGTASSTTFLRGDNTWATPAGGSGAATETIYLVDSYGAFGNGASHPLSATYGTLVAAQAVYPAATSLTQEVDFCAIQKAINAAQAAGGGTVVLNAKVYVMANSGTATGAASLVIPTCGFQSGVGQQVNLRGQGIMATSLRWDKDMASANNGAWGLACGPITATHANGTGRYGGNDYEGYFSDFRLIGPNTIGVLGTVHTKMSGIMWGSRRRMYRIAATGFYAGVDLVGDQTDWEGCYFQENYYGMYLNVPSDVSFGDFVFTKCFFDQNSMAGIGVNGAADLGSYIFVCCFIGTEPYGIFGESGTERLIISSTFLHCQFENIGNSWIFDDSATKQRDVTRTAFISPFFYWGDFATFGTTVNSRSRTAMMHLGIMDHVHMINIKDGSNWWDIGTAPTYIFNVTQITGLRLEGWIEGILDSVPNNKYMPGSLNAENGLALTWRDDSGKSGCFMISAGAVTVNNLLESAGVTVVPSTVSTTVPAVGIARDGASANQFFPVITQATQAVDVKASGTAPTGYVKKGASGAVVAATGPTDGVVVGCTFFNDTTSQIRIRLSI